MEGRPPPNVNANPLLNHKNGENIGVHMLKARKRQIVINIDNVRTPIKGIFEILVKIDSIKAISLEPKVQLHGSNSSK